MSSPIYGPTNPTPEEISHLPVKFFASMVELKPEKEEQYRRLHADVWPEVQAAIRRAKIRNFHLHIAELAGRQYLVSTFEYTGDDPATDFAKMAEDEVTRQKWWPLTDACQIRLPAAPAGRQWMPLEQVMHLD